MSFGSNGIGKFLGDSIKQQFMPWTGSSSGENNLVGNWLLPGIYTAYGTVMDRQEEIAEETRINEQESAAVVEGEKKVASDKITAAAAATAAKLKKRRGYKATILTSEDPSIMTSNETQGAEMLGG